LQQTIKSPNPALLQRTATQISGKNTKNRQYLHNTFLLWVDVVQSAAADWALRAAQSPIYYQ
jgi:hypothetical protein